MGRVYSAHGLDHEKFLLTLRDVKVVYNLNGITRPDWKTLPQNYKQTGDSRWDAINPANPTAVRRDYRT